MKIKWTFTLLGFRGGVNGGMLAIELEAKGQTSGSRTQGEKSGKGAVEKRRGSRMEFPCRWKAGWSSRLFYSREGTTAVSALPWGRFSERSRMLVVALSSSVGSLSRIPIQSIRIFLDQKPDISNRPVEMHISNTPFRRSKRSRKGGREGDN